MPEQPEFGNTWSAASRVANMGRRVRVAVNRKRKQGGGEKKEGQERVITSERLALDEN